MKIVRHLKYFIFLLALSLAGGPALRADDKPAAPAAPAAPAEPAKPETAAEPPPAGERPVRELAADDSKPETAAEDKADDEKADQSEASRSESPDGHRRYQHSGRNNERVSVGGDSTLAAGEKADKVISVLGSSTSAGEVRGEVVSIIGSSRVTEGTVDDKVVSVLGNTYVNGHVKGEVVAVLGNVELGPKAVVEGQIVCIGGVYKPDPAAVVKGNIQNIGVAGHYFNFDGLTVWFHQCLFYGRPLAFDRQLLWAWCIALSFLALYALIALVAPGGVMKCVNTLEQRPGSSLLAALLTMLLTPVAFILLAFTLAIAIGFVLIPTFSLGLFFAAIFGKVVMLAWLGRRFTKLLGDSPLAHPVFGVLIGGAIMLGLYTIPIVGLVTYKLLGILGLGVVVYTLISQAKANRPPRPAPAMAPAPGFTAAAGGAPAAFVDPATGTVPPPVAPVSLAPLVVSAATLPRVGFWIRVAAAFLDFILGFVTSAILLHGVLNYHGGAEINFLIWVAYHPIMWKMKGTTIGGIICGLKLVRLDDRPIDWGVAIVRCLTAFMSFVVMWLGFIWVAFDDERQSWHDKVAGTTIVKVPKGTALL